MKPFTPIFNVFFVAPLALMAWVCGTFCAPPRAQAQFPEKVFAPYVDVLLYPSFSLKTAYHETGQRYFTLAFVTSGGGCEPRWGGVIPMQDNHYMEEIAFIRSVGGDIIVSFGGANGIDLAMSCTDVTELQGAYQSVIDRYDLAWVDFDIEGAAVADRASIDRRNRVIRKLQDVNPDLKVAFCLPVLPQGLTQDGLYVLQNAKNHGVRIDVVNVMAMDYGDWAAPNPEGQMGKYAMDAADSVLLQCGQMGIQTAIGITPMIGQNDVPSEVFRLSDAAQLAAWANSQDWVHLLSFWSMGRDNGNCSGNPWASPLCSGLIQDDFSFTEAFASFGAGEGANIPPMVEIVLPQQNAVFKTGAVIEIKTDAQDPDGSVAGVSFFQDNLFLGADQEPPYSILTNALADGGYVFTAVAVDNQGAKTTSIAVSVTVADENGLTSAPWEVKTIYWGGDRVSHKGCEWEAKWWTQGEEPGTTGEWCVWKALTSAASGNQPPLVTVTDPFNGSAFPQGETIQITADAKDMDGWVSHVEFFAGPDSLGWVGAPPYEVFWQPAATGAYTITAVAVDNEGAETFSPSLTLTVTTTSGSCGALPDYPEGRGTYAGGDLIQNNGHIYECKPWPYTGWCNSDNPAYEPGAGWAWQDAWVLWGACAEF